MKKIAIVLSISFAIISCGFPDGSISIKHSQYSHYYEMTAKFNPDRTAAVERWLDKELSTGDVSFTDTEIDGNIMLDNHATFYIKKSPGFLNIKLDKEKNSDAVYQQLRAVCEGINEVVRWLSFEGRNDDAWKNFMSDKTGIYIVVLPVWL